MRQSTSITGFVRWLVGLLVTHLYDDPQVAPYWPTWPCSSVVLCFRCCSPLFIVVVVVFYSLLLSCWSRIQWCCLRVVIDAVYICDNSHQRGFVRWSVTHSSNIHTSHILASGWQKQGHTWHIVPRNYSTKVGLKDLIIEKNWGKEKKSRRKMEKSEG